MTFRIQVSKKEGKPTVYGLCGLALIQYPEFNEITGYWMYVCTRIYDEDTPWSIFFTFNSPENEASFIETYGKYFTEGYFYQYEEN